MANGVCGGDDFLVNSLEGDFLGWREEDSSAGMRRSAVGERGTAVVIGQSGVLENWSDTERKVERVWLRPP